MLSGALFGFWRIMELLTVIPTLGMLAWFVHGFQASNQLTPASILTLFIVSVLAAAWALATLFRYKSTKSSAHFVAFIDLCFVGAFIAAVYELRGIGKANCSHFSAGGFYVSLGPFGYFGRQSGSPWAVDVNKTCAMLKASWVFGIMNCIFFFLTSLLALLIHRHVKDDVTVKETHYTRRRRSHSGRSEGGGSRRHSSRSRSRRDPYYV
ncbi:MAG: hypothetical protein M1819_003024 [Sarea resinae]|nr:MAG: hypothetical protein M1819_003024 [Sarea resinae]